MSRWLLPFGRYDGRRVAVAVRNLHPARQQPRHRIDFHDHIDRAELSAAPVIRNSACAWATAMSDRCSLATFRRKIGWRWLLDRIDCFAENCKIGRIWVDVGRDH